MNANGKKVNKKKKNRKREKGEKGPPKKTNPVSRKQTKKHVIGQNCVKIMMTKKDMGVQNKLLPFGRNPEYSTLAKGQSIGVLA